MNNKDLHNGRTLTTFHSVIAQLVYQYGYFSGIDEFFSRSFIILHIYNLCWDCFLSWHILRSQEKNKAVLQMFDYLISKNTCHRNNHICSEFTIKWYVMSNKFSSIINSTLYIILFIDDDRWIKWTKAWQSSYIVTHHTCIGSSLLQWFFIMYIPALTVFLIYTWLLQSRKLVLYKYSVNLWLLNK